MKQRNTQSGVTLIELMVSMLIVSFAIAAAFAVGLSLMNGYRIHRKMVGVERSARVSLEIMAGALRNSSPGVPAGTIGDLVGCTTYGSLSVVNSTTGPDELKVMYASGGVLTSTRTTYTTGSTDMTVVDGSEFKVGDYAVITDLSRGHLVQITGVTAVGLLWQLDTLAPTAVCGAVAFPDYPAGSLIVRAKIARFYIDSSATVGFVPTLMMDPDDAGPAAGEPMAEGVEDLQIAVGVDSNGDGTVTDASSSTDEWHYNAAGDVAPPAIATTPPRAFRITLVARSVMENSTKPTSTRPAVEDRAGAGAADEFRRRILSSTVEIRNITGSPL